jgi:hypothetical protein
MMVYFLQDEDLGVAEVARHEEGHDLAAAILQDLIATGEAGDDQVAVRGVVAFADDILAWAVMPPILGCKPVQQPLVLIGKGGELLHLHDPGIAQRTLLASAVWLLRGHSG